jgi:hypothetical protein
MPGCRPTARAIAARRAKDLAALGFEPAHHRVDVERRIGEVGVDAGAHARLRRRAGTGAHARQQQQHGGEVAHAS